MFIWSVEPLDRTTETNLAVGDASPTGLKRKMNSYTAAASSLLGAYMTCTYRIV